MSYSRTIRIEFNHCDPAGIVFYPRYFEMTNSVVENFFREVLGHPFEAFTLRGGGGVPTVRVEAEFHRPSRLGDLVAFTLDVRRVGASSVTFRQVARCGDEVRMRADLTLVWVTGEGRAARWPDSLRTRLETMLREVEQDERA